MAQRTRASSPSVAASSNSTGEANCAFSALLNELEQPHWEQLTGGR